MFDNPEQMEKLQSILQRHSETQPEEAPKQDETEPKTEILTRDDNYEEKGNFPDGKPDVDDFNLWPGGPFRSQVEAWIEMFTKQNLDVGLSEFPTGEKFVWRCISRAEYKAIMNAANTTPLIREEMIVELCTLWPENYDYEVMATGKGGLPGALAKIIMRHSGFIEPKTTLL